MRKTALAVLKQRPDDAPLARHKGDPAMIKAFVVDNDRLRVVDDLPPITTRSSGPTFSCPTKEEEADDRAVDRRRHPDARGNGGDRDFVAPLCRERRLFHDRHAAGPRRRRRASHVAGDLRAGRQPAVTVRYHEPRAFQTFPDARREGRDRAAPTARPILDRAARSHRRSAGRPSRAREPRVIESSRTISSIRPRRRRPSATATSSSSCAGSAARKIWSSKIQDSL